MRGHVFLVGMPGSGKSSVGRSLAEVLGTRFVDLDRAVEDRAELSIDEIFERGGEDRFREVESEALESVAAGPLAVVACGGGVIGSERNRKTLRETGTVVYLATSLRRLRERAPVGAPGRPLLREEGDLERLFAEREPAYREVADVTVDGDGPAQDVARAAAEALS